MSGDRLRRRKAERILTAIAWIGENTPCWTRSEIGTVRRHDNPASAAYYLAGNPTATVHVCDPSDGAAS